MTAPDPDESREHERRAKGRNPVEYVLHWTYYWLDLYGLDKRPSHTKVLTAVGFFAIGVVVVRIGWTAAEISPEYVALCGLWLGIPVGKGVALSRRPNNGGAGVDDRG